MMSQEGQQEAAKVCQSLSRDSSDVTVRYTSLACRGIDRNSLIIRLTVFPLIQAAPHVTQQAIFLLCEKNCGTWSENPSGGDRMVLLELEELRYLLLPLRHILFIIMIIILFLAR